MKKYLLAACAFLMLGTNAALARITLETLEATVGSTYSYRTNGMLMFFGRKLHPL